MQTRTSVPGVDFEDLVSSMIYFDNAATSWPKPSDVIKAMTRFANEVGANPGRSGHRLAVEAARIVYAAREAHRFWPVAPVWIITG